MAFSVILIMVAVGGVGYLGFSIWSWRRLWRRGETPYGKMVYENGVKRVGFLFSVVMSLWMPSRSLLVLSADFWLAVAYHAFLSLPIGLWTGYFWGRAMANFFGIRPP